jgi:DNA-binding helix-hairpin-helix protein with protein kinase domain
MCSCLVHSRLLLQYVAHFNWDRRLEMLHDVAAGMSYLHGKDHVHGDLRSPNLFVGADSKVRAAAADHSGGVCLWQRVWS